MSGVTSRVAAVDCGTNSIRLLVADVTEAGLVDLTRRMEIVRLGAGVDRTGEFAPEALERTFAALRDYADEIKRLGATRIRMVATSATRDARNRDELVSGVRAVLGVEPEVISGDEEAALSFAGATAGLRAGRFGDGDGHGHGHGLAAAGEPCLVADIGGGSTELVLGNPWSAAADRGVRHITASRSVDVGCVRLAERHLRDDPPTPGQLAAVVADAQAAFDVAERTVPLTSTATLVGVAGTVTTVAALAAGLPGYDPERIHLSVTSAVAVAEVTERLARMTHDERTALPVMHPGRVDVIVAGTLVLRTLVERCGVGAVVASEHDILDGIAFSLASTPPHE